MKITTKIKYSLALVLFSVTLQAQETFPDDVQDVPINDYLPLLFMAGIGLVYWFTRKRKQAN
jgi:hypothetical protein